MLKQYKLEIDSSANPRDAVEKATYENYDIIFVNHQMEDMSGEEVVSKIEATGNKVPPVIGIITISSDKQTEKMYYEELMCPIEKRELNKIVLKVFKEGSEL